MSDNRKYYYLKLKENYFDDDSIGLLDIQMHIYYTGEDSGVPTITYQYTKSAVEGTMAAFDDTVKKIMKKDFRRCAEDPKVCNTCDFRFYCRGK